MKYARFASHFAIILTLVFLNAPTAWALQEPQETEPASQQAAAEAEQPPTQDPAAAQEPESAAEAEVASESQEETQETKTSDAATQAQLKSLEAAIKQLTEQLKELEQQKSAAASEPAPRSDGAPAQRESAASTTEEVGMEISADWLKEINWRELGPSNMAGRVSDIDVNQKDSSTWWIATAGGGLLKTTNQGTTVEHQFDRESTVSIGSIASDPTNTDVIWVGTGEANPRNSVSYGNGIYKSTDGGKTFEHLGLEETYQISRILIDPQESRHGLCRRGRTPLWHQ